MKKRRYVILGCIVVGVLLFVTLCMPHFILMADKQDKVAEEYAYCDSFLNEYEAVRTHLTASADALKAQGKQVLNCSHHGGARYRGIYRFGYAGCVLEGDLPWN